MYNPASTYRIQFHKDFTFKHLEAIIPYLQELGIGTIYASPIFKAVPGSTHGYDGVAPLQINPEIGTLGQLHKLAARLKAKGIGWIQDMVPNHMAFHSDNTWLMDVLEKGKLSPYYCFFDIHDIEKAPLMVPFLGAELADVLKNGELKIVWQDTRLRFDYAGNTWPLNLSGYMGVLQAQKGEWPATLSEKIKQLQLITDPAAYTTAFSEMIAAFETLMQIKQSGKLLSKINADQAFLAGLAGQQYYRLCSWQETDHTINYRRFFTVNGLICLNIQLPEVFAEFHRLIGELVKAKVFDGLRVDHIDGLYNPEKYLQQLRELTGPETYICVEKILEPGEAMPNWPVEGNTGYDFLAWVNNLLTRRDGEAGLAAYYQKLTGDDTRIAEQITLKKRHILTTYMGGEWNNLTQLFLDLKLADERELAAVTYKELKNAIAELLVACPVYRFYDHNPKALDELFSEIKSARKTLVPAITLLHRALRRKRALPFYQRLMQFTGPLMAKGVEDTLMYTNNHFIAHNEVGDSPAAAGITVSGFHRVMAQRQQHWPLSLNATATHDTKRGEDVRARLQVLPDVADEWLTLVQSWQKQAGANSTNVTANDSYFIYQTLLGAYPMPGQETGNFPERLNEYLEKTLREGKENSDWANPNLNYEQAVKAFAAQLLNKKLPFWKTFEPFYAKVADFGIVNSLAQLLLKFTCPGVPDIYQGCDHWDFSLVDPDNRRPVDYQLRTRLLSGVQKNTHTDLVQTLWHNRFNGQIKIWLTALLAAERRQQPSLFTNGNYVPLQVKGKYSAHIIAFARQLSRSWYVVAVPLGLASLMDQVADLTGFDWADTHIVLPDGAPFNALNLLTDAEFSISKAVAVSSLFKTLPLAFLKLQQPENPRGAGILLPLASLPSPFGIGDFGPEARKFTDILKSCGQKYWQLLPLSPVSAAQQYSPYSAHSSFAGNEWLISPQLLADEGLLRSKTLKKYLVASTGKIDYRKAEIIKQCLFNDAWENYCAGLSSQLHEAFQAFCARESYWLNDYALYINLRKYHQDAPWYQWPVKYKNRNAAALKKFQQENAAEVEKSKWLQFLFTRQLESFKNYCNNLNIKLFGDLPFYVSYDSADVWANPEIFSLDNNGNMTQVAGVPPDYFNANGQLWGMPVFNWQQLKQRNFDWWIQRIKKNLQYFDLLRLDHFRAFSSYWSVPATETTAINGTWVEAPGLEFFKVLKDELGRLPLVAEDLGDIDEAVYTLRDKFGLPGMKVLQFAWGDDMPASPHIPHNYYANFVAYTGTHDNNTTKGWYRHGTDKNIRKNLRNYIGQKVKSKKISPALIKLAFASVARIAVIPLQDWLNLDQDARLNTPAALADNWIWRVTAEQLKHLPLKKIRQWTMRYNRA